MFSDTTCVYCEASAVRDYALEVRMKHGYTPFDLSVLSDRLREALLFDTVCSYCDNKTIVRGTIPSCLSCTNSFAKPCNVCLGLGCYPANKAHLEEFISSIEVDKPFPYALIKCSFAYCSGGLVYATDSRYGEALSTHQWIKFGSPKCDPEYAIKLNLNVLTEVEIRQAGTLEHQVTVNAVAQSLNTARLGFLRTSPLSVLLSADYSMPELISFREVNQVQRLG
jgi:hypothetical protein